MCTHVHVGVGGRSFISSWVSLDSKWRDIAGEKLAVTVREAKERLCEGQRTHNKDSFLSIHFIPRIF